MTEMIDLHTVVGFVRHNGKLACIECSEPKTGEPIFIDSPPHAYEACDFCGVVLNHRFRAPEANQ